MACFASRRSAALLVPSAVTRHDWNLVINSEHPDFRRLTGSEPASVFWQRWLLQR